MIQKTQKSQVARRAANAGSARVRTWSHKTASQRNRFAPKDDRTIKRDAPQCDLRRPNWKGKFPCVVRILPNFNYEDPSGPFDPTRLDVETDNAFSDWWRSVPSARQIGLDQQFTFLLYDPRRVLSGEYDPNENPYVIFARAINGTAKKGEAIIRGKDVMTAKWGVYIKDKKVRYAENLGFCQALIYQNGDELYAKNGLPLGANEKDLPQIIQVSRTAEKSFLPMVDERTPDYEGDPADQSAAYRHGDIVSLTDGKFVAFYDPQTKTDDVIKLGNLNLGNSSDEEADAIVHDFLRSYTSHGIDPLAEDYKGNGWGAAILNAFKYELSGRSRSCPIDLTAKPELEEAVMRNVMWWDDLLHFPEHEEICMMMAHAYCSEPNLLEYGWTDNPEFFTDEVRGILRSRTYHAAPQAELLEGSPSAESDEPLEDNGEVDDADTFVPPRVATRASATIPKQTSYADVDEVPDDDLDNEDTGVDAEEPELEPEEQEEEEPVVAPPVKSSTVKPVPKSLLDKLKKIKNKT